MAFNHVAYAVRNKTNDDASDRYNDAVNLAEAEYEIAMRVALLHLQAATDASKRAFEKVCDNG